MNIGDKVTILSSPYQGLDPGTESKIVSMESQPGSGVPLVGIMPIREWTVDDLDINRDGKGYTMFEYELVVK